MKSKLLTVFFLLSFCCFGQKDPYQGLIRFLDNVNPTLPPGEFTCFVGLEFEFVSMRFQLFVQDDYMHLTPAPKNDCIVRENTVIFNFVPRISTGKEYLKAIFTLKTDHGKIAYLESYSPVKVVEKVEIIGSADIVFRFFCHYWNQDITLGGYKPGELAHYQFMGDYISLFAITPQTYKIVIEHGNITMDYYKTFHIE